MRLFELGPERPKKAGKATLKYSGEVKIPERRGKTIILPELQGMELFPLQEDWNQLLIETSDSVWFGGTDENPFLVRMNPGIVKYLFQGGPEAFYKTILPENLLGISSRLSIPYLRQGDIFALPLPFTWKELARAHWILKGTEVEIQTRVSLSLLGTRHHLNGKFAEVYIFGREGRSLLIEGIVTAPDHSPVELKDKPYLIEQTKGLYEPQKAD